MKIQILTQYYSPEIGAAATRWTDYSRLIAEMGHEVTVICQKPNYPNINLFDKQRINNYETYKGLSLRIYRVWVWINDRDSFLKRIIYFNSFMITAIIKSIRLPRPDVYIASSPSLFTGLGGVIISKLYGKPLILDIRDIWPESAIELGELTSTFSKNIGFILQKMIYSKSNAFLVAVPGFSKHLSSKNYSSGKKIIPLLNGVGDEFINKGEIVSNYFSDTINLIYAGNIGLAQDFETIIKAAKLLGNKYNFIIIGDGIFKKKVLKSINDLNIQNVIIKNPMTKKELINEYAKAHIGIVSLKDKNIFRNAIPSKTWEYMSCGLAVVCTIKGDIENLINESKGGICIEPENAEVFANTIKNLTWEKIDTMGECGKIYVKSKLRKSNLIINVINEIESTII